MKRLTVPMIREWRPRPCYDPTTVVSEDWSGIVLDVLALDIPIKDRFWVVLREELLSPKILCLFAVRCAREVQHLMKDERSLNVLDVAERFALGRATDYELREARAAARAVALAADWAAALAAALAADWSAAALVAALTRADSVAAGSTRERQLEILRELINEFPDEVK